MRAKRTRCAAFARGESVDEIARARGFAPTTILSHLVLAIEAGAPLTSAQFFTPPQQKEIAAAFGRTGGRNLTGLRDDLGGKYDMAELRVFRALAGANGQR
jgi:hypothetical protein